MSNISKKLKNERKVEYIKIGINRNLIKLSTAYDKNCSEQEYQEVNDITLEFILKNEREMASQENYYNKKTSPFPDRDDKVNTLKLLSPSSEECYLSNYNTEEIQKLLDIFSLLTECQRRRIDLYYRQGYTYKQISEQENVAIGTVQSSIDLALEKLREYRHILQKTDIKRWIDLLY